MKSTRPSVPGTVSRPRSSSQSPEAISALGELFVLLDGDCLVVKPVEPVRSEGAADRPGRLPLVSANPDYPTVASTTPATAQLRTTDTDLMIRLGRACHHRAQMRRA